MNHKILIVDDETVNLRLMERLFRRAYDVVTALSGKEALELLGQHDVALIISDQRMPGMTGIEFLKCAAEMRRHTVRIILTGYTDINALVEAINSGVVYKYVSKPWLNEDLLQTVKRGIEVYEANKRLHRLSSNNERLSAELKSAQTAFVRLAATALGARSEKALEHALLTADYSVAVGERLLCLAPGEIEQLSLAAQLHSIGQIGIPNNVFFNKTDFSDEEGLVYVEQTEKILAGFPEMDDIAVAVLHHRENFDGSGSPAGLSGQRIPLFSRIIAVAAAFAEMVGHSSVPSDKAINKLLEESGKLYDPVVINALQQVAASKDKPRLSGVGAG